MDKKPNLQLQLETQRNIAALMLQEREYFAEQIRDIRIAIEELDDSNDIVSRIERILARPNPMP